jgi:hypothetical protein
VLGPQQKDEGLKALDELVNRYQQEEKAKINK